VHDPTPLGGVVFVRHDAQLGAPALRTIPAAEAAARLYANALNPLAHSSHGLDAAVELARRLPSVALDAADLRASCALVVRWMESV
jgi:hypothetical protein